MDWIYNKGIGCHAYSYQPQKASSTRSGCHTLLNISVYHNYYTFHTQLLFILYYVRCFELMVIAILLCSHIHLFTLLAVQQHVHCSFFSAAGCMSLFKCCTGHGSSVSSRRFSISYAHYKYLHYNINIIIRFSLAQRVLQLHINSWTHSLHSYIQIEMKSGTSMKLKETFSNCQWQ